MPSVYVVVVTDLELQKRSFDEAGLDDTSRASTPKGSASKKSTPQATAAKKRKV